MDVHTLMYAIIGLAALMAFANARTIRLPTTIAIMSGSLLISLLLLILSRYGLTTLEQNLTTQLAGLDFYELLMESMLSLLLFAGALNVNINYLRQRKWEIVSLAFMGTILSTFLVGSFSYYLLHTMGIGIPYIYCLLFGALISPTDPIAVLAIFKQVNAPKSLDVTVAGESLFNDGVGIVLFITLFQIAFAGKTAHWHEVAMLFLRLAIGGILYGALLGYVGYRLIKPVEQDYKVTTLITLGIATGGYALAEWLEVSGPLAMVVAGLFIGNHGRLFNLQEKTRENLDNFWELIDEILNAVLFLLIGFELLIIRPTGWQILAGILIIPLVLLVRLVTVASIMSIFKRKKNYVPHFVKILTWGGLRGGLAVALALSLPMSLYRNLILTMTYAVVVFAIIVQGLSIKSLVVASEHREKQP